MQREIEGADHAWRETHAPFQLQRVALTAHTDRARSALSTRTMTDAFILSPACLSAACCSEGSVIGRTAQAQKAKPLFVHVQKEPELAPRLAARRGHYLALTCSDGEGVPMMVDLCGPSEITMCKCIADGMCFMRLLNRVGWHAGGRVRGGPI